MIEKAFGDIKGRLGFRTPKAENAETLRGKMLCVFVGRVIATGSLREKETSPL
jgi:hypothetical protein